MGPRVGHGMHVGVVLGGQQDIGISRKVLGGIYCKPMY